MLIKFKQGINKNQKTLERAEISRQNFKKTCTKKKEERGGRKEERREREKSPMNAVGDSTLCTTSLTVEIRSDEVLK